MLKERGQDDLVKIQQELRQLIAIATRSYLSSAPVNDNNNDVTDRNIDVTDRNIDVTDHNSDVKFCNSDITDYNNDVTSCNKDVMDRDSCNVGEPWIVSLYRHITPVIQKGPSCGLSALCMAIEQITGSAVSLLQVLHSAQQLNYTRQGEMFSAANLLSLAQHTVPTLQGRLLDNTTDVEKSMTGRIIDELVQGNVLLIPYDRDYNNEPCKRRGQRAHWTTATGLVLNVTPDEFNSLSQGESDTVDATMKNLLHATSLSNWRRDTALVDSRTTFLYCFHGKSVSVRLWKLSDVIESNSQLIELDPQISASLQDYVIPPEGIVGGLCGKMIVFYKNSS